MCSRAILGDGTLPFSLLLLNHPLGELLVVMPIVADLKFWITGVENPFIEESPHIPTGRIFNGTNQIEGLHILPAMPTDIELNGFPELLFSQLRAQEIENQTTFLIKVRIKQIYWLNIGIANNRPSIMTLIFR